MTISAPSFPPIDAARLLFAETNDVTRPQLRSAAGATISIYATADPDDVAAVDCVDTLGAALADPFLVDQWSRIPDFFGPIGITHLYVSVDGGPRQMIVAKLEPRVQILESTAGSSDSSIAALVTGVNTNTSAIATEVSARTAGDAALVPLTQKGAASGVATLDSGGRVPIGQLPAITLNTVWAAVASQAAMLALSSAEPGDVAIRSDVPQDFVLAALPASTLSNWKQLAGTGVTSVAGKTGSVTLGPSDVGSAPAVVALSAGGTPQGANSAFLRAWAPSQSFIITDSAPTYDATYGTLTAANITWPDGATGAYAATLDTTSTNPGGVTSFTATYVAAGQATLTVTVTVPRNGSGQVSGTMSVAVA